MLHPVVEERVVVWLAGHGAEVVLGRKHAGIVDEFELIVFAAEPPDDLARLPVELGAFVQVAARDYNMSVEVDAHRVHMHVVDVGGRQALPCVRDLEVVPAAPLHHQVAVGVEFLHVLPQDHGVWISAVDHFAHVPLPFLVDDKQRMAVGQQLEAVVVGLVLAGAAQRIDRGKRVVQRHPAV